MKNQRLILSVLLVVSMLLLIFSSCVSSKKYNDAVSKKTDLEKRVSKLDAQYTMLDGQYKELQKERDQLAASSSGTLKMKEAELAEKENALKEREKKIQEMKLDMKAQRDAIINLKQEVCSALKCFTPDELSVEVRNGKLYVSMSDKLLFPSGSDEVNKRGKEAISMLAAVLSNSDLEIMVEGHTDIVPISSGRNKDNWDLSVHRATSVTRIFSENGIAPARIIACGRGEFHPLASNESADGRQQNRRTEIVLAPKLDRLWDLTDQEGINTSVNMNGKK